MNQNFNQMRRIIPAIVVASLISIQGQAQDQSQANNEDQESALVSKKGEKFLPEAGDWGLGINAAPFFRYLGNVANGNNNNTSPSFMSSAGLAIYGKYFTKDDFAWRGSLRFLGINNTEDVAYVNDDLNTDPYVFVRDSRKQSQMQIGLSFGFEKRRGSTRLQGYYGAEVFVNFGNSKDVYSYGNVMALTNPSPTSNEFGDGNAISPNVRLLERDYGTMFMGGVRPFIGAEYFIFPKMSIGGELGITIAAGSDAPDALTVEYYDPGTVGVPASIKTATYNDDQSNATTLIIDNDNVGGMIRLMLHF